MQRVGNLIQDFHKDIGKLLRLKDAWPDIAGEVLSSHTQPAALKSGTLHIICDAPAWVQQVDIMSAALIQQVRNVTGLRVKACSGRFGMLSETRTTPREKLPPQKPALDGNVVKHVQNPEFRKLLEPLLGIGEGNGD